MKSLILHNKSSAKVVRGERELSFSDLTEEPRGTIPGEWILLLDLSSKRNYLAYVNSFSENYFKIKIICEDSEKQFNSIPFFLAVKNQYNSEFLLTEPI